MLAIDAGFATQEVYHWVRQQHTNRVMAVKGVDKALVPLGTPKKVDVSHRGQTLKRGVKLWPAGVSILKSELYQRLKLSPTCHAAEGSIQKNADERLDSDCRQNDKVNQTSYPDGYCHHPKYDPEYFKQLTAEQLVTKTVKGYPKREWQKLRDRNEALDCRIYARAAAIACGIDRGNVSMTFRSKVPVACKWVTQKNI